MSNKECIDLEDAENEAEYISNIIRGYSVGKTTE